MAEVLILNRSQDISKYGRLLYSQPKGHHFVEVEEKAPYMSQSTGTVQNPVLWQWEKVFTEFQEMASRVREFSELDVPDIFTLHPLETQEITLQITEIIPARFYYVPDLDSEDE